jgi:multiple sugar transport system substrate-binding protein
MRLNAIWMVVAILVVGATFAATAAARGTGAAKTVTVTFWHSYNANSTEQKQLEQVIIPRFEKTHAGIKVKDVAVPYEQLHQKLVTAVAGGSLPDLVRSDIIWVPELADLGVLAPLDSSLPGFKALTKTVYPGPLATNFWKGHYYGLPLDTNTQVWTYNRAAMEAAGLSAPPKTFAQLKSMAATAKAKGIYLYTDTDTSSWNMLPFIWSNGGDITNKTYTKATGFLNSAKSVAAVQMLVDMYKAGEVPDVVLGGTGGLSVYDGIAQGKYVGTSDGPWMYSIFDSSYKGVPLASATFPAGAGGSVSVVGGEDVVLTKASKNKSAAIAFMRFLLTPWAQSQMAKVGQMPVLPSLGKQLVKIHPYYAVYVKQLANARARTPTPKWPQIDQIVTQSIAKAFTGELSVKQALDDAARQIDGLL